MSLRIALRRLHLLVVTTQSADIALYQSPGFRIYGTEREAFSRDGSFCDEHWLELPLCDQPCGEDDF